MQNQIKYYYCDVQVRLNRWLVAEGCTYYLHMYRNLIAKLNSSTVRGST